MQICQSIKNSRGWATQAIFEALQMHGPMTKLQINKCLKPALCYYTLKRALSRMMVNNTQFPKRIYISGWKFEFDGKVKKQKAVYAIGNLPNALKPSPVPNNIRNAAYKERKQRRAAQAMGVFQLVRETTNGKAGKRV